jgi:hypothetical protein
VSDEVLEQRLFVHTKEKVALHGSVPIPQGFGDGAETNIALTLKRVSPTPSCSLYLWVRIPQVMLPAKSSRLSAAENGVACPSIARVHESVRF